MIPEELTRYLQTLDFSINKPFKDELNKRCTKYFMDKQNIEAGISK